MLFGDGNIGRLTGSEGGPCSDDISAFIRTDTRGLALSQSFFGPRKAKRASKEETLTRNIHGGTQIWSSSLQNYDKINFHYLSHTVCSVWL
jgi:hypothetical protein